MLFRTPSAELAIRGAVVAIGAALVAAAVGADSRWFEEHWLSSYCTRSPLTPPLEATARVLTGGAGLALATLASRRIALWVSRRSPGELLRRCAAIVIAVALSLVVSDAVLRHRRSEQQRSEANFLPPMAIDPTGNYRPLPSQTKDITLGNRVVRYSIDADGNRAASSDHVADPNAPTILFTGESVGIGWGVAYEQSYPALVATALGVQVVNVSVTGFSNDQAYLRARDTLAKLARPIAIVTIAVAEQLERNVSPTRDHLVLSPDGRLELEPASTSLWATSPLRKIAYHASEAIPLTRAILRATADLAHSRQAIPLFLWTNYGPPCDLTDRGTSTLEERLFAGVGGAHARVDIAADQTIHGFADAHPDERGHQALARAVLEALHAGTRSSR